MNNYRLLALAHPLRLLFAWISLKPLEYEVVLNSFLKLLEIGRYETSLLVVHIQEGGIHSLVVRHRLPSSCWWCAGFIHSVFAK